MDEGEAGPLRPAARPVDGEFERHTYAPHAHAEFTIGVCVGGSEVIDYRGGHIRTGPGSIVVLAPGEMHTGGPATQTDGYAYRAMYADPSLLTDGTLVGTGTPHFRDPVLDDPELAAAFRHAHTTLSTCPDPLEANPPPLAADGPVPPPLDGAAGTGPHTRRGRCRPPGPGPPGRRTDLPAVARRPGRGPGPLPLPTPPGLPYDDGRPAVRWLAQYRVNRARGLLEAGLRPAEVATLVGFADQAHLTRWFRAGAGGDPGGVPQQRSRRGTPARLKLTV